MLCWPGMLGTCSRSSALAISVGGWVDVQTPGSGCVHVAFWVSMSVSACGPEVCSAAQTTKLYRACMCDMYVDAYCPVE